MSIARMTIWNVFCDDKDPARGSIGACIAGTDNGGRSGSEEAARARREGWWVAQTGGEAYCPLHRERNGHGGDPRPAVVL